MPMNNDGICPDRAEYWGKRIRFLERVTSTNDIARELARAGEGEGTVITSREQISGKGRLSRAWHSPPGGLWFSIILRPPLQRLEGITLLFSLWIIEFLEKTYDLGLHLYWPNDIYAENEKMGGILTESSIRNGLAEWVIVGIGLNVNNSDFPPGISATSLSSHAGKPVEPELLLKDLLSFLEAEYHAFIDGGFSPFSRAITGHCPMIGKEVMITNHRGRRKMRVERIGIRGQLVTKDENGNLEEIVSAERVLFPCPATPP